MNSRNELDPIKVMIAGIGGASLGTEIYKSLILAGGYEIFGCDISRTAYGLYEPGFSKTWLIPRGDYISSVLKACLEAQVKFLIPGGEEPMKLLNSAANLFEEEGICLLSNSPKIISTFSDKAETFKRLAEYGISVPRTIAVNSTDDIKFVGLPCIIKPATGSGGSTGVFFAISEEEAMLYAEFIHRAGSVPIAQEYIDEKEGEFTIGVLSLPNAKVVGSIALRRVLDAKLSVAYRGNGGVISSGYSQGYISYNKNLCDQAEKISHAIGSLGPINIQGRVRNGVLLPFEINPRFSASTYLRAMAGFNEIDILIKYLIDGTLADSIKIKEGFYLRSLNEKFIEIK